MATATGSDATVGFVADRVRAALTGIDASHDMSVSEHQIGQSGKRGETTCIHTHYSPLQLQHVERVQKLALTLAKAE